MAGRNDLKIAILRGRPTGRPVCGSQLDERGATYDH